MTLYHFPSAQHSKNCLAALYEEHMNRLASEKAREGIF